MLEATAAKIFSADYSPPNFLTASRRAQYSALTFNVQAEGVNQSIDG
jgi:hypothetical protein